MPDLAAPAGRDGAWNRRSVKYSGAAHTEPQEDEHGDARAYADLRREVRLQEVVAERFRTLLEASAVRPLVDQALRAMPSPGSV